MTVFLVYHHCDYEFDCVIGVYSDYIKARNCELQYLKNHTMHNGDWTEIRKVEVDNDYSDVNMFSGIGERL